ncbi:hypothetical protein GGX14DRAFT_608018 [Mycena pura]|uniref:Beta-galactosidase jelly roll domain-containing protein n=1 Tax=Mycena pura TaxID=153505 RepID=A0AAD6YEH3_9AGAR|nr:hypothetical protein GGX14DRAFT_608018 [Mycena pura]
MATFRFAPSVLQLAPARTSRSNVVLKYRTPARDRPVESLEVLQAESSNPGKCQPALSPKRGHFDSTGHETAVNLSITGGRAFAGSVWLNDVFIGAAYGNSSNNDVALCGQMMHWATQFS